MKYSAKKAADLKAALDSIQPDHRDYAGLCAAVKRHLRSVYGWPEDVSSGIITDVRTLQESLTKQWHQYSGDMLYPLPGEAAAYYKYASCPRVPGVNEAYMWDRATSQYAELRWQLIEYLREQCAKIIEERRIADMLHHVLLRVQAKRVCADGICDNIRSILMSDPNTYYYSKDRHDLRCLMDNLFKKWPEYSGHPSYPVCTIYMAYGNEPREQFITASSAHTMWRGEYGRARMRLLDFLIERTKPE